MISKQDNYTNTSPGLNAGNKVNWNLTNTHGGPGFLMKYFAILIVFFSPVLSVADNYMVPTSGGPGIMCDGDYTHDTTRTESYFDVCTGSLTIGPLVQAPGVQWCSSEVTIRNLNTGETSQQILPQNSWNSIWYSSPQECADLPLEFGPGGCND